MKLELELRKIQEEEGEQQKDFFVGEEFKEPRNKPRNMPSSDSFHIPGVHSSKNVKIISVFSNHNQADRSSESEEGEYEQLQFRQSQS